MTQEGTWADEVGPQVRAEVDALLDEAVRLAQQRLDRSGRLHPFAITPTGVLPEDESGRPADVEEMVARCWESVRAAATAESDPPLRVAAVVTDVLLAEGDAIAVAVEHREAPALEVFLPYAFQGKTNGKKPAQRILYGDLRAESRPRRIWPERPRQTT